MRFPGRAALATMVILASAWGDASAQQRRPGTDAAEGSLSTAYRIGPGDLLEVIVWKDPDLTRAVAVRLDGMITLPLLGDLLAAGRAPSQLASTIAEGLKRYVEAPVVAVEVKQANSARFYVLGQVTSSGEYPLSGGTTVLHGLALAGGFREYAKLDEIKLIRRDGTVVPINYEHLADGKNVRQNVLLRPGDTLVVP